MDLHQHIALLEKKVEREREARRTAEKLLEAKSRELFNANLLVQKSLDKLEARAESDSELLAYQMRIEKQLLEFGRKFLKHPPNEALFQALADALVDNHTIRACGLYLRCELDKGLNVSYTSGRQQKWTSPDTLHLNGDYWDAKDGTLWLSLSNHAVDGFFVTRINTLPEWSQTIQQHMHLFGEMLRSSIDRQLKLEEAIRARQQAEASEKSTRDFLAMINHELRTPLNGLLGSAELLADTSLDQHQHRLLSTLNHSGELLRAIINDLLDYSKINAGMLELANKPFDSHNLATVLNDIFQHRANEKQLALNIHCQPDTPRWLIGDEDRIKQIYVNLIGNAIKFTQKGSVSAELCWRDNALSFSVTDTGCGIPVASQQDLFEPFTQADNSSQRNHEGTGLGLAICKKLTEQMNGAIGVNSQENAGATFTVALPLEPHHADNTTNLISPDLPGPIDALRVLVVEDLKTNQMIITLMMSKFGIQPVIAENGQQALDILKNTEFDIILMDCRMPIMDGYTTTEKLRKSGYRKPIVALTAGTTTAEREDCFACGMDDILCKPYQASELREMLEKWGA